MQLLFVAGADSIAELLLSLTCHKDSRPLPSSLTRIAERLKSLAKFCQSNINNSCKSQATVLHLATTKYDESLLRLVLSHGPRIDQAVFGGIQAIHYAAERGAVSNLSLLISAGADPSSVTHRGISVLHLAARSSSLECVKLLLRLNCPIGSCQEGRTPIHVATHSENVEILKLLVNAAPDLINKRDNIGSPLHWAAMNPDIRHLEFLLFVSEIEVSLPNSGGNPSLHVAAINGNVEHTRLLLDAGADSAARDIQGYTALDQALLEARSSVAQLIFNRSAAPIHFNDTQPQCKRNDLVLSLLLSRIRKNPCNLRYYAAVGRIHLKEGNMEMASQFFDKTYYIFRTMEPWTDLPSSYLRRAWLCSECTTDCNNRPRHICLKCIPEHNVCDDCFRSLPARHPRIFFVDHAFHRIPSNLQFRSLFDGWNRHAQRRSNSGDGNQ